jgi:hypothetical protein
LFWAEYSPECSGTSGNDSSWLNAWGSYRNRDENLINERRLRRCQKECSTDSLED